MQVIIDLGEYIWGRENLVLDACCISPASADADFALMPGIKLIGKSEMIEGVGSYEVLWSDDSSESRRQTGLL